MCGRCRVRFILPGNFFGEGYSMDKVAIFADWANVYQNIKRAAKELSVKGFDHNNICHLTYFFTPLSALMKKSFASISTTPPRCRDRKLKHILVKLRGLMPLLVQTSIFIGGQRRSQATPNPPPLINRIYLIVNRKSYIRK